MKVPPHPLWARYPTPHTNISVKISLEMRRFPAFFALLATAAGLVAWAAGDDNRSLGGRTRQYLTELIRLDTSNPPGNESKVASYLKQVADANGIPAELLGADPKRLNLVAGL